MRGWIAALLLSALPAWASDLPKGLTASQVEGLRAARGMGLSLPAELNGKPGPLHVLELAEPLGLSEVQRASMAALVEEMKRDAIDLGERIIATEGELDRLFHTAAPDEAAIAASVGEIGRLNSDLRLVHLRTHLAAARQLTPEQIARYTELRRRHHHGG